MRPDPTTVSPPELSLTPAGALVLRGDAVPARLRDGFAESSSAGLFTLANEKSADAASASLRYWREFARDVLVALAGAPLSEDPSAAGAAPVPPPAHADLARRAGAAPMMPGAEYLDAARLAQLWQSLDGWARSSASEASLTLDRWLATHAPAYHGVGRVCLHLAENPLDESWPFAFMATYAPRLGPGGRVVYKPLGNALKEFASESQHDALLRLLRPVHVAASRCDWLKQLLDSGDVFAPLAWTQAEAYQFLTDVPQLEASGLAARVPNWWRARSRPRVSVTIGRASGGAFGADAMLDFNIGYAVGDETLNSQEIEALLSEGESLVRLKGQWVELDAARLREALAHWQTVERDVAAGGLGFAEGMRLLAGAPVDLGTDDTALAVHNWSQVVAGKWLSGQLARLRDPASQRLDNVGLEGTLRPYQESGRDWLWLLSGLGLGACLADDMGLGKTIQIIAVLLAHKAKRKKGTPPSLLVLPASLLANWEAELQRFGPRLRVQFIHPSYTDRATLKAFADAPETVHTRRDLVVTTYGMLTRQSWLLDLKWHLVILDEAQAIKNAGTRQARTVKQLTSHARIAMTGTPVENRLGDLWSLFDFINPGLLGSARRFGDFAKSLAQAGGDGYAPLRALVQPYILRRLKSDRSIITDLPDKTELNAWCGLSRPQAALYAKAVRELADGLEQREGIERRGMVLAALMRFKQICNHPAQATGDGDYEAARSGKFARLRELCDEIASRQEKMLVFTQFREMTGPLATFLAEVFGREGSVLHGGTHVKRRQTLVDSFARDDGPPFMVLSLKAGGVGLNLTAASHVIHFDRWWNPAVEAQATDRAYRIGQQRNVMVHKFVCRGTVEERIDEMITDKLGLADALIGGSAEKGLTEMSDEALLAAVALDIESAKL